MEDKLAYFTQFINTTNVVFFFVLLIGGKVWSQRIEIVPNKAINFLLFASIIGGLWLLIKAAVMRDLQRADIEGLFLTYLLCTSFYEVLGKWAIKQVESIFKAQRKLKKP